jgi:hypothetical protein
MKQAQRGNKEVSEISELRDMLGTDRRVPDVEDEIRRLPPKKKAA